jgi:hypothetical protein
MAQPASDRGQGERLDAAPLARTLGAGRRVGAGARDVGRHAARRSDAPTLILDSCSVRAKRAGDLPGPNPTDRGKQGTKYHVAVTGEGVPVACVATAANVNDTLVFERLFLAAFAVMARIETVFADTGSRRCSPTKATTPSVTASCAAASAPKLTSTSEGGRTARGWESGAGPSSAATPGCWRTSASPYATTGSASSSNPCSRPHAYSWLQAGSLVNCENRLLPRSIVWLLLIRDPADQCERSQG